MTCNSEVPRGDRPAGTNSTDLSRRAVGQGRWDQPTGARFTHNKQRVVAGARGYAALSGQLMSRSHAKIEVVIAINQVPRHEDV